MKGALRGVTSQRPCLRGVDRGGGERATFGTVPTSRDDKNVSLTLRFLRQASLGRKPEGRPTPITGPHWHSSTFGAAILPSAAHVQTRKHFLFQDLREFVSQNCCSAGCAAPCFALWLCVGRRDKPPLHEDRTHAGPISSLLRRVQLVARPSSCRRAPALKPTVRPSTAAARAGPVGCAADVRAGSRCARCGAQG